MLADQRFMIGWALRLAESEPVADRIKIYRALAEWCGDPAETQELHARANDLEKAHYRCREFALDFSQRGPR
jgi:hypothetical protein